MKSKRIAGLFITALSCAILSVAPGAAAQEAEDGATLSTDNMSVSWDEIGAVRSVVLQGKECIAESVSGFIITDAGSGKEFSFQAPLTGGEVKKQSGAVAGADLLLDVTYRREGHAICVEGTVAASKVNFRWVRPSYRSRSRLSLMP